MSITVRTARQSPLHLLAAMRFFAAGLAISLSLIPAARAAIDETIPNADGFAALEDRALHAKPREQCFLYTQLAHTMAEKAAREISAGDDDQAASTLGQVDRYAHLIQQTLARDTHRLKDAQELMHHTSYRLAQYLHLTDEQDQKAMQETLRQLNQVNDQLLRQVFSH